MSQLQIENRQKEGLCSVGHQMEKKNEAQYKVGVKNWRSVFLIPQAQELAIIIARSDYMCMMAKVGETVVVCQELYLMLLDTLGLLCP